MSFQNKEKRINIKEASIEIEGLSDNKKYQDIKYLDNILGCIYGNCLGDAYGLSTEFLNKEKICELYPDPNVFIDFPNYITNRHNRRWDKGDWTDDTDQMILILQTLIECNGEIDIKLFSNKLKNWVENGFEELGDQSGMGLGQTVGSVVFNENFQDEPTMVSKFVWINGGKKMAANGSLMRTSILGCMDFLDDAKVFQNTLECCKVTHYDSRCIVSCLLFTKIISDILKYNNNNNNQDDEKLKIIIDQIINNLTNNQKYNQIANLLFQSNQMISKEEKIENFKLFNQYVNFNEWSELDLDEGSSIGYVYKCLGSAILSLRKFNQYYFQNNNDSKEKSFVFRKVLDELIREGGDSDTNGSTAGSLLGSIIGYSNLPKDMLLALPNKSWLDQQVLKFIDIVIDRINSNKINSFTFNNLKDQLPLSYINETDDNPYINFNLKNKNKKMESNINVENKNSNCSVQ
ncbi:hypothetical protein DICPUDRAFT_159538 [Dictyostelium purpureum]|uniref:ADP-ribosylglycohydrolase n=1 Tax=Dictyostelium purpureum TaxID=5786 RepID=F1A4D4_DICPU|nr:uncharacterized protein DICPUDRAFT_159538 [Dictyostelium purpureum]EGC28948.1 hypothetical protein DICPUDRAFT_159538 [Dictyostelium purpureum]|eukprot:XP_003294529.1 hypothetical protein DICPUDRAFT_159538 [Dictyostelium purpureum]